ncbi:MAG: D-glycerate dehydrogenase [Polyangiaceae bacterium]|nr:D-glycerate dehydrogenase [Polyangiaceae bacterium]
MARVLVSGPLPGTDLSRLYQMHQVEVGSSPQGLGGDGFRERLSDHEAIIPFVTDAIDRAVLDRAPNLRVVANCGVGVNNIDLALCRERKIVVTNTPNVLTDATADATMALILDACRGVTTGDRLVRKGEWKGWAPTEFLGVRVTGARLGIVGLGRIGKAVSVRARAFSMVVAYTQRTQLPPPEEQALGVVYTDLETLFAQSDIVCLCCPLTPETRGLVSRDRLLRMKKGAVLVNTARGPCVDEEALAEALQSGHLFSAGLDVYADEPRIAPALLRCENVVLAPHLASADRPTREAMARICIEAVLTVLDGKEPPTRVA